MAGATMLSSSQSSTVVKNPSLGALSNPRLFNGVLPGNNVSFSTRFNHVSLRCYASSAGFDRVRVLNPIVEMDGNFYKEFINDAFVG